LLTGAYLPTGPSAPLIRPVLYKHIEHQQQAHPHHVHILAGDMNAALYTSDRAQGRQGPLDKAYRQVHQNPGTPPHGPSTDRPHPAEGRDRTFYTQDDPTQGAVSRIDDILVNSPIAQRPDTRTRIIDTCELNTDHQGLEATLSYTTLGQLPLPLTPGPNTHPKPRTLITPLPKEHKTKLTEALADQLHSEISQL
jgi:hypothetical protein